MNINGFSSMKSLGAEVMGLTLQCESSSLTSPGALVASPPQARGCEIVGSPLGSSDEHLHVFTWGAEESLWTPPPLCGDGGLAAHPCLAGRHKGAPPAVPCSITAGGGTQGGCQG